MLILERLPFVDGSAETHISELRRGRADLEQQCQAVLRQSAPILRSMREAGTSPEARMWFDEILAEL